MRLFAATLGLIGSVSIALAQNAPPQIPTKGLAALKAMIDKRASAQAAAPAGRPNSPLNGSGKATSATSSLGWHVAHPANCGWLTASGNQYFYVVMQEGDFIFAANNLFANDGLEITCNSGNWMGWHVIDSSSGAFDVTASFTFK